MSTFFQLFMGRGRAVRRPAQGWDTAQQGGRWWWAAVRQRSPCTSAQGQSEHRKQHTKLQKSKNKYKTITSKNIHLCTVKLHLIYMTNLTKAWL